MVASNWLHNVPVIFIKSTPSSLFLRKGSSHKNRLEIDPFPLNLVESQQSRVQNGEPSFKFLYLRFEPASILILFDGGHQSLMVGDFCHKIFPLLDQSGHPSHWVVLAYFKLSCDAPGFQIVKSNPNIHLSSWPWLQFSDLVLLPQKIRIQKLSECELICWCNIFDLENGKKHSPMLLLEILASETA